MRFFVMLIAVLFAALAPQLANAQAPSCHIGKPSYCAKYGGSAICEKSNVFGKAACAKWMQACFSCHDDIPPCLGNKRPPADTPLCKTCSSKWSACMAKIDKRFWPNRMTSRR